MNRFDGPSTVAARKVTISSIAETSHRPGNSGRAEVRGKRPQGLIGENTYG
jgi:hypothetical protein